MTRIGLTRWLVGHTRDMLAPLAASVVSRILGQLLGVALLVIAAWAVVTAGAPSDTSDAGVSLGILILVMAGIALAKALVRYLEHYCGHWVAFRALQRLRELFFARLIPQAPAATSSHVDADLTERAIRDIDRVEVFYAHTLPPAVSAVLVPAAALTWLGIAVDGTLALTLAPFIVIAVFGVPLLAAGATWRAARSVAAARGIVATQVGDDIQGVREVLAFGAQDARLAALGRADDDAHAAARRASAVRAVRSAVMTALQLGALVAVALVGVQQDAPTLSIALALAVGVGLWGPTKGVDEFTAGLDAAFAAAGRLQRIIDAPPLVRDPARPAPFPADSTVELERVSVRYPGASDDALHEVSVRFRPAHWTSVVGVSGSGKSTLGALLPRGIDPSSGSITIGGIPLDALALDDVRRAVAIVAQHPVLVRGTIGDNLRLSAPDADDERVFDALRIVDLDRWAREQPQGLDTPVRDRGADVSGGQLQRLALARALVQNPRVLVLDEALSQLDADTASTVRTRLLERAHGVTVVEITHRVDLISDDAQVIVLDGGREVDAGTAGTLRQHDGPFRRLEARGPVT